MWVIFILYILYCVGGLLEKEMEWVYFIYFYERLCLFEGYFQDLIKELRIYFEFRYGVQFSSLYSFS